MGYDIPEDHSSSRPAGTYAVPRTNAERGALSRARKQEVLALKKSKAFYKALHKGGKGDAD
jgi:hypothetical protein